MGYDAHTAFERSEEWKAARLTEMEFEDMARALKTVALERGQPTGPVLDQLSHGGLTAALVALADGVGEPVDAEYWRCRAQARQG